MKGQRRAWLRALSVTPLLAAVTVRAQDPRAAVIAQVAREWLELVDRADVAASHDRAGAKFRNAVSVKQWADAYEKERRPRGALTQRAVFQTNFDTRLSKTQGEGEYASLVFRTAFANQPDARETITLERESDGKWRVIGYFIR